MITSRANDRLKALRRARKGRGDAMLIEGPHLLGEALDHGLEPGAVLATPAFLASPTGVQLAGRLASPPLAAEPSLLDELADSDSPRGIVALVARPRRALADVPRQAGGRYVYLDGVQDPGNLGAVARVAEAAGVVALVLAPGCAGADHPRALRASAGSLLRLPIAARTGPDELAHHLDAIAPVTWVGLTAHGGASLYETAVAGTVVLAIGGETHGLGQAVERRIGSRVTIPLQRTVESLNVATAAAVALFELARRDRRPAPDAR